MTKDVYRGRIAPSPTGYLHVGHAMTFCRAQERARAAGGKLILRIEDIDQARCRPEFTEALLEDLRWFDLSWNEGPDLGGPFSPYAQSERRAFYLDALQKLRAAGLIYPCICSRKDVLSAATAPHDENEEPIYPGTCRPTSCDSATSIACAAATHWRFRVPDGEELSFNDGRLGIQKAIAGRDFGDFVVWRRDDVPAYQLAVVADDAAMQITEVVRGEDLLVSTFRQVLLYRALAVAPPKFFHTPLISDRDGKRIAKRNGAVSLRELRARGIAPEQLRSVEFRLHSSISS
jgi:glutamyl/glutaminyl-tRNA synthetase